jgi:radical SAM protein with 4Fe4S-binding SPASM domain
MIRKILQIIKQNQKGYEIGRKILNLKFVQDNFFYKKIYNKKIKKRIKELEKNPPKEVDIGTTNSCNANCVMCPHNKLKKMGTMKEDLFKKIINDCVKIGVKSVCLSFFGEPFLDKKIIERIKYAKEKGLKVSFYSNASLMNKEKAKNIIESGLDNIVISFEGTDKENYEKIRRNLKFEDTKRNIEDLVELKKEMNSLKPNIGLVFVEINQSDNDIKNYCDYWKSKVQSIQRINMRNWAGQIKGSSEKSLHFNNKNRTPCANLWEKLTIDWNGDAVLCCDDWSHSVVLGNLKKQNLKEIWKGKKLKHIREIHKNGEFSKIPLCAKCNKKSVWWLV